MTTTPVALTLEIRSEDGSCTEFFLEQEDSVRRALRLLVTPRLFAQPLLVRASRSSICAIPCRTIDMILASTAAPILVRWPAGFLDMVEIPGHDSGAETTLEDAMCGDSLEPANAHTLYTHIYTLGNWVVTLKAKAVAQSTDHNQRLLLARLFGVPVLPFRLAAGGVGLINSAKISHATALPPVERGRMSQWPGLNAVPDRVVPARLLRRTPRLPGNGGDA